MEERIIMIRVVESGYAYNLHLVFILIVKYKIIFIPLMKG